MSNKNETSILLIDDDLNFLHGIKRTLRGSTFKSVFANSAEKAFEILSSTQVAVVVTDQRMPGLKGLELLSIIREKYPTAVRIMLTGHPSLPTTLEAINRGEVFRFLSKPCEPEQLRSSLEAGILFHSQLIGKKPEDVNINKSAEVLSLEQQYPGISSVEFDEQGRISIEDVE